MQLETTDTDIKLQVAVLKRSLAINEACLLEARTVPGAPPRSAVLTSYKSVHFKAAVQSKAAQC